MGNYKIRGVSPVTVVEDYTNASTFTTKTFTLPATDDFTGTAYYELIIEGSATAALGLYMQLNGITSGYHQDGRSIIGGTEALINLSATSQIVVAGVALLTAAERPFYTRLTITLDRTSAAANLLCLVSVSGGLPGSEETMALASSSTNLASIKIYTSTSSLIAGMRMTLYKHSRS